MNEHGNKYKKCNTIEEWKLFCEINLQNFITHKFKWYVLHLVFSIFSLEMSVGFCAAPDALALLLILCLFSVSG